MKRAGIAAIFATIAAFCALTISQAVSKPSAAGQRRPTQAASGQFSVLGRGRAAAASPSTALPQSVDESLTKPGTIVSEYELEPDHAAFVEVDASTHVWIIPGHNGMCVAVPAFHGISVASSCGPASSVNADGLIMVRRPSSGPVIYGVVPDGASVTVIDKDGSSVQVPAKNNVFVYVGGNPGSVSIRAASGALSTTSIGPSQ
ncbi:MAG TPA: hypothetical protein VGG08_05390 [Solirubrobacteraceae bacterium]|jgi:hypothetical protein